MEVVLQAVPPSHPISFSISVVAVLAVAVAVITTTTTTGSILISGIYFFKCCLPGNGVGVGKEGDGEGAGTKRRNGLIEVTFYTLHLNERLGIPG